MQVSVFSAEYLDSLTAEASASPRRRQHRNVHVDYGEPVQRLFNAITRASYIRPHRHGAVPRVETMLGVRGRLALVLFDETGGVTEIVPFGTTSSGARLAVGVEIPPATWHTVVALDDDAILFEVKAGPFDPQAPKELAPWAPAEGTADAVGYLARIRDRVEARLGAR